GGWRLLLPRGQEIGLAGGRAIADAEMDRAWIAAREQCRERGLVVLRKHLDRAEISAERLQLPLLPVEEVDRDSRIVLQDRGAIRQQELADLGEVALVHQIGRALDQTVDWGEPFAEFEKAAAADGVIGEIGAEIIERLRPAVRARDHDLAAVRCAPRAASVRLLVAVCIEIDEARVAHGLAGAREKDEENRRGPAELPRRQLGAHVARDE